jgi:hypothetical protein
MTMPAHDRAVLLMFARALVTIDADLRGDDGINVVLSAWVSDIAATHPEMLDRVSALAPAPRRAA